MEAVTEMLLEYDESVDAAYLVIYDGTWHHQERLDDARGVNYAVDGSVMGIEILSPRRGASSWTDCRTRRMWHG
jgi:uncharacterized protein YuzE